MANDSTFSSDRRVSTLNQLLTDEGKKATGSEIEMVGYSGKVPKWKTVDFYMTSRSSTEKLSWRNILDDSGSVIGSVNSNVLLIPDEATLQVVGEMDATTEQDKSSVGKGLTNILDYMQEASSVFNDTVIVPEYSMPTFKDLKALKLPQNMKFVFRYGNAGLYSGFEEVVKPVIALIGFFAPQTEQSGSVSVVTTPWPTKSKAMYGKIMSFINKKTISDITSSVSNKDSLTENISSLNASIQNALNSAAKDFSYSKDYNNIFISYGRLTLGPMMYTNYNYTFNMDQLDEDGWPIYGSFEVGGLSSPRKATKQALLSSFVRG